MIIGTSSSVATISFKFESAVETRAGLMMSSPDRIASPMVMASLLFLFYDFVQIAKWLMKLSKPGGDLRGESRNRRQLRQSLLVSSKRTQSASERDTQTLHAINNVVKIFCVPKGSEPRPPKIVAEMSSNLGTQVQFRRHDVSLLADQCTATIAEILLNSGHLSR